MRRRANHANPSSDHRTDNVAVRQARFVTNRGGLDISFMEDVLSGNGLVLQRGEQDGRHSRIVDEFFCYFRRGPYSRTIADRFSETKAFQSALKTWCRTLDRDINGLLL